jgi:4-hydroxy-2-oxoheptanedioate aldolase
MTTEVPRLNGAIRALEAGKPVFVSLANAEIGIAQAIGAAPHEGVVFEMEHNPRDVSRTRLRSP